MKYLFFSILFLLFVSPASMLQAQSAYEAGMQKAFALYEAGKNAEAVALFERISKAEADQLVVSNNRKDRKALHTSNGIGLLNIRERYELLGYSPPIINDDHQFFTVKLPLL